MNFNIKQWICKPSISLLLNILSGLSFFILCLLLPLVGPAGSRVEHSIENKFIFLNWLLITFSLSILSFISKKIQSKDMNYPTPYYSYSLLITVSLFLIVFLFNGFSL